MPVYRLDVFIVSVGSQCLCVDWMCSLFQLAVSACVLTGCVHCFSWQSVPVYRLDVFIVSVGSQCLCVDWMCSLFQLAVSACV